VIALRLSTTSRALYKCTKCKHEIYAKAQWNPKGHRDTVAITEGQLPPEVRGDIANFSPAKGRGLADLDLLNAGISNLKIPLNVLLLVVC
jgi:hypothetical protein